MSALQQFAGRRLLFLNWRDLTNPAAGGAEAYAEQIAQRFAAAGAGVTLFTSEYDDAQPHDWENDYLVVRRGGRFGVYAAAAQHLRRYGRRYDAVVDFQNGIPFFSPLWAPKGTVVVCVVHHVHQEQFNLYFRWPFNHLGRFLEGTVSRRIYGWRPFVAVSPSTRTEMRTQLGLRGPIHVVPNGVQPLPASRIPCSSDPAIAVVTRLVPHKRLHLLVEAMPPLLRRWPGLRLHIGGTGPAREALRTLATGLGVERAVSLPGRVTEQAKSDLYGAAWLTVMPSLAEGWGLTVIEANTLGTPAVGFNVPGLRDSIRDGRTGWLVPASADLTSTLAGALDELQDPDRRNFMADQCRRWAAAFSWDSSAERLAGLLLSEIKDRELGRTGRRSVVDLCTVASWPSDQADEDLERRLRKTLGMNDVITRHARGLSVLMCGCDEVAAAAALRRAQVPPARLRLATSTAVLSGSDGDESW
jgi:glycosyltransferase involved in cell wall biosynthesis